MSSGPCLCGDPACSACGGGVRRCALCGRPDDDELCVHFMLVEGEHFDDVVYRPEFKAAAEKAEANAARAEDEFWNKYAAEFDKQARGTE